VTPDVRNEKGQREVHREHGALEGIIYIGTL
jgi:hypothetical protein